MRQFRKVAVGGTFDQLHKGHKALLSKAFEVGDRVAIGVTSDSFVSKLDKKHRTASFEDRKRELRAYLTEQGLMDRAEIVPLDNSFGLTITSPDLDAIVVSQETERIAKIINCKRENSGKPPLQVIVVTMVPAENHCPISTTRIRRGEIDRNGHLLQRTA
ncbi:MAG: phosphopantetheine adenylyltransferase [Methanocella sp.]|jgi:pantetheine-phosphate adenylyltransferase